MRTSIWMVRHGQTELNRTRRYQGASDSPLTAYGLQQNDALTCRLRSIPLTVAIASPCNRTRATAATILECRAARIPIQEDARWSEMHQGRWEGMTYREVMAQFPDEVNTRFADALHGRATGGESLRDVAQRVYAGWESLLQNYQGERILIVTHALPIQLMLCSISGMPVTDYWHWRIDLGSVTGIGIYASGPIVRMVNEVPPL